MTNVLGFFWSAMRVRPLSDYDYEEKCRRNDDARRQATLGVFVDNPLSTARTYAYPFATQEQKDLAASLRRLTDERQKIADAGYPGPGNTYFVKYPPEAVE